jgi:transcriptional regulator with XRE-family HTH domain
MADEWTPGKQLKRWRGELTAAEVAVALGVTTQTVSNWETDRFQPHISKSAQIEDLYGLERGMVAALLQGDKPPPDLIDANAVGIENGRLQWSFRQFVYPEQIPSKHAVGQAHITAESRVSGKGFKSSEAKAHSGIGLEELPADDQEQVLALVRRLRRANGLPEEP